MKKLCMFFGAVTMLVCIFVQPVAAAGNFGVSASSAEGAVGSQINITLTVTENPGVAYYIATLSYDTSVFELVNVTNGSVIADLDQGKNLAWSADNDSTALGTLATLTFKIKDNAKAGTYAISLIGFECFGILEDYAAPNASASVTVTCPHANTENIPETPAKCNEIGYTAGVYCNDCKTYISGHTEIPASGNHVDADGKWEFDGTNHWHTCSCTQVFDLGTCSGGTATCKSEAICSTCGNKWGTIGGHDYNTAVWGYKAAEGHAHVCKTCGENDTVLSHTPDRAAATCANDKICSACEFVLESAIGHDYTEQIKDEAHLKDKADNCTEYNTYWYDCSRCEANAKNDAKATDKFYTDTVAGPHIFTEQLADAAHFVAGSGANCQDAKRYYYDCAHCNTVGTEIWVSTEFGAHEFDTTEWGYKDDKYHANTCACGAADLANKAEHVPGPKATEDTDQVCTVCNKVLVPATGHRHELHLTSVPAKTPACETAGHLAYWQCICPEAPCFEDAEGKVAIADIDAWKAEGGRGYVKANGHSFNTKISDELATEATCLAPATYYVQCDNCTEITKEKTLNKDDVKNADNHTSSVIVYKNINDDTHDEHYECCDAVKAAGAAHDHDADTHTCACGNEHHTHDRYEKDKTGHWSVCSCGKVLTPVLDHDNEGESCDDCGHVYHTCGGAEMTPYEKPASACDPSRSTRYYRCSCGKIYSDIDGYNEVSFTIHNVKIIDAVAPTCTTPGRTKSFRCLVCRQNVGNPTTLPALGHEWSDWTVTEAATEEKTGLETRTCKTCNETETRIIPELNHVHNLVKVEAKAATCETDGNIEYWYCSGCDWVEVAGGMASNLQAVKTPAVHTFEHHDAKEATCSENGNIAYDICTVCGTVEVDGGVKSNILAVQTPAAHKLVKVDAVAATCETNGNITYWYCENCDWMEAEGGVATNKLSVITPAAHTLVKVDAVAATCEATGNIEYWYCSNCDWVEVAGGVASNLQAVKTPAAHTFEHHDAKAATCFEMGNIAYDLCTVCGTVEVDGGVKSNLLAVQLPVVHTVEHVEAKAPTATELGNIEYWYCKDCGYAWLDEACTQNTNLKAVVLPATGESTGSDESPKTGDSAIFFIVALVAVATVGVAVVSFKKREN